MICTEFVLCRAYAENSSRMCRRIAESCHVQLQHLCMEKEPGSFQNVASYLVYTASERVFKHPKQTPRMLPLLEIQVISLIL